LANAALASVRILAARHGLRQRLAANRDYLRDGLRRAGWPVPETPGPIVSLAPEGRGTLARLKRALLEAGVFPPLIRYPGGPARSYFRFAVASEHTRAQLDAVIAAVGEGRTRRPERLCAGGHPGS
jgi:7-keto-8-aminopelargonate synthetase-like enzyme